MKTLAELELESIDGFKNPDLTPHEHAVINARREAKRAYEAEHTPLADPAEEEDQDEE